MASLIVTIFFFTLVFTSCLVLGRFYFWGFFFSSLYTVFFFFFFVSFYIYFFLFLCVFSVWGLSVCLFSFFSVLISPGLQCHSSVAFKINSVVLERRRRIISPELYCCCCYRGIVSSIYKSQERRRLHLHRTSQLFGFATFRSY